ncbi:GTPase-activating protein gyp10 [Colletotrichum graminicola]|uniref:GTPase-activating protein gyp10 n=1 Tax=Colletotrichum graminicola (strain M1.001 / M2 / FGSC 10212) TaxID=645133 RepID=E3Q9P8_COLGM|nr:GTPase-activating protein gyp10 [Colletotrichum graminicola M1.001]EFQ27586.1 GTPase-activating protein gyp10 [Colletotrichum graminicola M1.001]WDK11771.1 GTPase-activating protein gyp10 [Colletotrichum graminicola]
MEADRAAGEQPFLSYDSVTDIQLQGETVDPSQRKTEDILEACKWRNIEALKGLAGTRGGFLTDALRRKAWPILLGPTDSESSEDTVATEKEEKGSWKDLPRHRDEEQVALDVNRAFIYYPNHQNDTELEKNKSELSDLIIEVLRRYPYLCYFQGYHDICQVFMLVLEPPWRARLVSRLSVLRIRDFMLTNLEPTVAQLRLIPDILQAADPNLKRHLAGTEPFYALAGTLTMYAHDIQTYGEISRLFDILLVREPVFSVYMFAQIVLNRRDELFDNDEDDPSMLHLILSKVPQKMDLESLIASATALYERYPPESLSAWRRISEASSLKTARSVEVCAKQTMDEGHAYFQKQLAELKALERRQKLMRMLWMYRKGAATAGLAIVVGLVAVYLGRRNSSPVSALVDLYSKWTNGTNWTHNF